MSKEIQQQVRLPLAKAVQIAWRNIRVRLGRSLLVTSGIILALAFLTYVLTSDAIGRAATDFAIDKADGRDPVLLGHLKQIVPAADAKLLADLRERDLVVNAEPEALLLYLQERGLLPAADTEQARAARLGHATRFTGEADAALLEDYKERKLITDEADAQAKQAQTWWLVGLALLVAFVGILNAMLMSVTERFAEIGTMKCLGALDSFIVKLFLLESAFQGLAGTACGVVIGLILAVVEGLFTFGGAAGESMPWGEVLRFVGICLVTGTILTVAAGLYPAWRAARMQPVDAMRTEV